MKLPNECKHDHVESFDNGCSWRCLDCDSVNTRGAGWTPKIIGVVNIDEITKPKAKPKHVEPHEEKEEHHANRKHAKHSR